MQKFPTQLLGNSIPHTYTVKNLSVTFGSGNTFTSHIAKVCRVCYYSESKYNAAKLQKILNRICRIVFRIHRTSHVTPFLQKLHWLPIFHFILFE